MIDVAIDEIWKPIPLSDGYEVSNKGRVKSPSIITRQNKVLPSRILSCNNLNSYGYPRCTLRMTDGTRKEFLIHRLVALAFIPNEDKTKTDINHKDENKLNNDASNLEWCTKGENNNYGSRTLQVKIIQADRYRLYNVKEQKFVSNVFVGLKELAAYLNVSITTASVYTGRVINGYKIVRLTNHKKNNYYNIKWNYDGIR